MVSFQSKLHRVVLGPKNVIFLFEIPFKSVEQKSNFFCCRTKFWVCIKLNLKSIFRLSFHFWHMKRVYSVYGKYFFFLFSCVLAISTSNCVTLWTLSIFRHLLINSQFWILSTSLWHCELFSFYLIMLLHLHTRSHSKGGCNSIKKKQQIINWDHFIVCVCVGVYVWIHVCECVR